MFTFKKTDTESVTWDDLSLAQFILHLYAILSFWFPQSTLCFCFFLYYTSISVQISLNWADVPCCPTGSLNESKKKAVFQSWQQGYLMTRLVRIRLSSIQSAVHRGHWLESLRVSPLFSLCWPSAECRLGLRGETTGRVLGEGQLRRPGHPAPPPRGPAQWIMLSERGDLFYNSRKVGQLQKEGRWKRVYWEGGGGTGQERRKGCRVEFVWDRVGAVI